MKKLIAIAILAAAQISQSAEMKKCTTSVKIKDPGNVMARAEQFWTQDFIRKMQETMVGSNSYQGIVYQVQGGANCIIDNYTSGDRSLKSHVTRDQRGLNCVIETATALPFVLTDTAADMVTGTIETVGDIFEVDAVAAARAGVNIAADGLNENRERLNNNEGNSFFSFLGASGNGILAFFSGSFGATSKAIGAILGGIAARLNIVYEIPKDIIQQSIRTGEQLLVFEPGNAQKSARQVFWRVINAVPSVLVGCEVENKMVVPTEADKAAWRGQRQPN